MLRSTLRMLPLLWLLPLLALAASAPRHAAHVQQLTLSFAMPAPFCTDGTDCLGDVLIGITAESTCVPNELAVTVQFNAFNQDSLLTEVPLTGDYPNYSIAGRFPVGQHSFIVVAEDACGHSSSDTIAFSMVDCGVPSPICISSGLSVMLLPQPEGGAASLWGPEFIASPLSDCTPPIVYRIRREAGLPSFDSFGIELTLTCDDFNPLPGASSAVISVEIFAFDSAFNPYAVQPDGTVGGPNYGYCVTSIYLSDPFGLCSPITTTGSITGTIIKPDSTSLVSADIQLSGAQEGYSSTLPFGPYNFADLAPGDYTVTPFRDGNYTNGVTVLDLVLIVRHILGIQFFDNPYSLIAADVNGSGTITVLDLIALRQLILFADVTAIPNPSWVFIPSSYVFPDPANPWAEVFPQSIDINLAAGDTAMANFIGVKIGDVDCSG